ncbi:hypothetical protein D3C87_2074070 [compost metagenome]
MTGLPIGIGCGRRRDNGLSYERLGCFPVPFRHYPIGSGVDVFLGFNEGHVMQVGCFGPDFLGGEQAFFGEKLQQGS